MGCSPNGRWPAGTIHRSHRQARTYCNTRHPCLIACLPAYLPTSRAYHRYSHSMDTTFGPIASLITLVLSVPDECC